MTPAARRPSPGSFSGWIADLYDGHGFTRSDALTGFLDQGYKYATDWSGPEWIDDQTVLVSNGLGWPSSPIAIEKAGSGDPRSWFADPDNLHPMEATISRDKRWVAAVKGPDRLALSVYRIGDGPLDKADVFPCFTYSDPAGFRYDSPTISGDGKTIAWGSGKSLYIAPLGDASTSCPQGQASREVIPGADGPDWGPAYVPTTRPADVPLGGTPSGGGGGGAPAPAPTPGTDVKAGPGPVPAPAPHATRSLTLRVGAARLAAALRSGLTVSVTAPAAGRLTAVARNGRAKVATGTATAKAGKPVMVRLAFAKGAKARLKRARKVALTVTVRGGGLSQATKVTLKR